jgi:Gpi18-like mannosyltransferase
VNAAKGAFATVNRAGLKTVLPVYALIRILMTLWMWSVRQVISDPISPDPILRPYLGVEIEASAWLEPWQRWDTLHYQAIAERGYAAFEGALFTPPLYPSLMGAVSSLTGISTLVAGVAISNLAYLGALLAFYRLAQLELKDDQMATRATLYLALFPTSFFFLAAYSEPLLLLGASLAIYAARRRQWLKSGVSAAFAALSRLVGAVLVIPLGYAALRSSRTSSSPRRWLAAIGAIAGGMVLPLYAWLGLGLDPLAPLEAQTGRFRGGFSLPGANLLEAVRRLTSGQAFMADAFDLVFLILFIACGYFVWRKYSKVTAIYYVSMLSLYLVRFAGSQPLLGTARYVLMLFPAFFVLAEWGRRPWANRLILYSSFAGLLFLSGQFAIWGWVG